MVRADAPGDVLERAGAMVAELENYPVVDEEDFCELECTEAQETWENSSLSDRQHYIRDTGVSLFSIRRDYPPSDDCGIIQQRLLGN